MHPWLVVILSIAYLLLLFGIAYRAQKVRVFQSSTRAWIYALSLGVYCTAWTYYGSVGKASKDGLDFLAVYTGPLLIAPLSWFVIRKLIRISQVQRTTTIADFISSRYGKNITLGSIVTLFCFIGIIPYISLQLKAISESFDIITNNHFQGGAQDALLNNTSILVVVILALFTILFGTRKIETAERHQGMMAAIAFESIIKLLAFLILGVFITYSVFNGLGDIFEKAIADPNLTNLMVLPSNEGYREWFWITLLSAIAFILLPRQFQVGIVENTNERDLQTSSWVFPAYLFLINLFVLPVALAGLLILGNTEVNPDYYLLHLPLHYGKNALALFIFIGGISAATSMIVVETMALSIMFSNNLFIPLIVGSEKLKERLTPHLSALTLWSRRGSIILVLVLAYFYYHGLDRLYSLVSIGLISFVSVAQFAPALLGGIYWKKATKAGALAGILSGFAIWFYTLVIPSLTSHTETGQYIMSFGLFGLEFLQPHQLFGLEGFSPIAHATFWSLLFNVVLFISVSLYTNQTDTEKNQSEIFVDIFKYSAIYESTVIVKGKASLTDITQALATFFGPERSKQVVRLFAKKYEIDISHTDAADPRIIAYSERLLSGVIGSASARMMLSSIVSEEKVNREDVANLLKESQMLASSNRELALKSAELKQALGELENLNIKLQENDKLKDDFLSTVTHELRTPITSIRAFSEILFDNPDLEVPDRQHYLSIVIKETERLSRLISQVLDLERYESGRQKITLHRIYCAELIQDSLEALDQLIKEKEVSIEVINASPDIDIYCDKDKMIQVFLNLISNALKFIESKTGKIKIYSQVTQDQVQFEVSDNGKGIDKEFQQLIFEKFFQAKNQLSKKPKGTGLGLAICKKILDLHQGGISVESTPGKGTSFKFFFPLNPIKIIQEQQKTNES